MARCQTSAGPLPELCDKSPLNRPLGTNFSVSIKIQNVSLRTFYIKISQKISTILFCSILDMKNQWLINLRRKVGNIWGYEIRKLLLVIISHHWYSISMALSVGIGCGHQYIKPPRSDQQCSVCSVRSTLNVTDFNIIWLACCPQQMGHNIE